MQRHWLLLRGLTREVRHWDHFVRVFESHTGDVAHCLDLIGAGSEFESTAPWSISKQTDHLRGRLNLIRQEHAVQSWGILGLSMGGMIALDWTQRYPKDFASAVIINASSKEVGPPWHRFLPQNYPMLLRAPQLSPEKLEELKLKATLNLRYDLPSLASEYFEYARTHPVSIKNAIRQMVSSARFRAGRRKSAAPTLILAGQKDRLVSVECSLSLSRRYGYPLALHPQAGHDLPVDDARWVAEQVRKFSASTQVAQR